MTSLSQLATAVTWLLLLTCGHVTHAQVEFPGPCPPTPVIHDFDWYRYLGRWNDVFRYFVFYQEIGKCWSGTYTMDRRGQVSVTLRLRDKLLGKPLKITVNVDQQSPYTPNKLYYSVPGLPILRDNYEVLRTDYDNWTIEYSCREKPFGRHAQQVWILTRSPHPSRAVLQEAFYALKQLRIRLRPLRPSDQSCSLRGKPIHIYGRSLQTGNATVVT
ncbi:apolipoprotein D-like [Amphibalanus amphitrite]|uniref:apolipoprotein D-like n=1 Tax=Amphibalanus amphitrite TaxID=1232801 RepID=UPI001C92B2DF|nr:apolipoprotein D-like [Amphibalanus amphitrite]